MALGASPTADTFADKLDYPDDEFEERWEGDFNIDEDDPHETVAGVKVPVGFCETILQNLDCVTLEELEELEDEESLTVYEYWGDSVPITFTKTEEGMVASIGDQKFLVTW